VHRPPGAQAQPRAQHAGHDERKQEVESECASADPYRPVAGGERDDRVANPEPGRYWWVTDDHAVVGVALQSPTTFFATLTPMTRSAVLTLAETISDTVPDLPGINGEAGTSAAFAGHPLEIQGTGAARFVETVVDVPGSLEIRFGEPTGTA